MKSQTQTPRVHSSTMNENVCKLEKGVDREVCYVNEDPDEKREGKKESEEGHKATLTQTHQGRSIRKSFG